jgi:bacterioferritin-associated ferredoxin
MVARPRRAFARRARCLKENAMYVCVCNAVTDGEIRSAVKLGVRSLADLSSTLGVATCCGRCTECARSVLDESLAAARAHAGCGDD